MSDYVEPIFVDLVPAPSPDDIFVVIGTEVSESMALDKENLVTNVTSTMSAGAIYTALLVAFNRDSSKDRYGGEHNIPSILRRMQFVYQAEFEQISLELEAALIEYIHPSCTVEIRDKTTILISIDGSRFLAKKKNGSKSEGSHIFDIKKII